MLVSVILFASATCFTPGLGQSSAYAGANALANAYAGYPGYGAIANANSYAFLYPSYGYGGFPYCTYDRCTPTCLRPLQQYCRPNSNPCNCPPGSIISGPGGNCVWIQQCPIYRNCNDPNASYSDCPIKCPSTCARPNAEYCNTQCADPGCVCNPGYLLSSINGRCIKPEQCPGGKVCNKNEVFASCIAECPNLYCPVDTARFSCGPDIPCPSRCVCESDYVWTSVTNKTCILKSECPNLIQ